MVGGLPGCVSQIRAKAFNPYFSYQLAVCPRLPVCCQWVNWRLASGIEVDFVIGDMQVAIEVKSSGHIHSDHLKGLRNIIVDHPGIERRIVVCTESRPRKTSEGIEIMPAEEFADRLWDGDIIL